MALVTFAQFYPWDGFGNVCDLHAYAFVMDGHIHMMSRQLLQGLDIELAKTASEIREIKRRGKIAAFLDLEGGFDSDGDLNLLRALHRLGSHVQCRSLDTRRSGSGKYLAGTGFG